MNGAARVGDWVEVHQTVLEPGERAPRVPADTRAVALEMRVKGRLVADAQIGDDVEIVTSAGRRIRGTLAVINPAYAHGFGAPIDELSAVGAELRAMIEKSRQ